MNTKLLRKIVKVIQEKPREFNMKFWHHDKKDKEMWDSGRSVEAFCSLPEERRIACSTTHCIAGWAQALSKDRNCKKPAETDARRLLEITPLQARKLFLCHNWPSEFRGKNDDWKPSIKQAVARIERFIETEGRE